MGKPRNANKYSKFQLFVLLYLYARQVEEGTLMVSDFNKRVKMTIKEFSNLAPAEILPNGEKDVRDELDDLRMDLLITDTGDQYYLTNNDGVIYVRKYLYYLASRVPNSQEVSNLLDNANAKKELKELLVGILESLRDRSQDDIADILVKSAKQYGSVAIALLGQIFQQINA